MPPAQGAIKLDAMENPYTWPDELRRLWLAELERVEVNRYPSATADVLKQVMRESLDIPEGVALMLGNGSDELIQVLALALGGADRIFLAPEPSFVMYRQISRVVDTEFVGVPLAWPDFSLDRESMLAAVQSHQPALIFIAWPNNPTGNLFAEELLLEIIKEAPGLVVIDEAYHAFSGTSFAGHLGEFDNLLVMRTLSKSGLAGLRLGYLMGQEDWLSELEKVRLPYNINSLTQKTAEFILRHPDLLEEQAAQIRSDREQLFADMQALDGITVWPSAANFLLFRTEGKPAIEIFEGLGKQSVLIKNMHGSHPQLRDCLRVTVGSEDENAKFLESLKRLL